MFKKISIVALKPDSALSTELPGKPAANTLYKKEENLIKQLVYPSEFYLVQKYK